jgi:ATPase subunit of ABC transporter with duplicated ATPase domains
MTLLHVERLCFAFNEAQPVVEDATFTLTSGWTGLVGPNGSGKTTLLRLLTGELSPQRGVIRCSPADLRVELCAQELKEPDQRIALFADSNDRAAHRVRATLRLDSLERWDSSSAGERKRWQIGAALASEPDVLLLDEPSNHLDQQALAWLVSALRHYRGIGMMVSHDRALLDELSAHTLRLTDGNAQMYVGAYAQAREAWLLEAEQARSQRLQAKARVRAVEKQLQDARAAQAGANANRSAGRRMKNRHDSDARGILASTKAAWAEASHGRDVELLRRELSRAGEQLEHARVDKQLGKPVFADYARADAPVIALIPSQTLQAGTRSLLELPALTLRRDDRVWISGPNGAGKSTLQRALLKQLRLSQQEVLVLPQELSEHALQESLARLRALSPLERGRVLSIVAGLGVDPDRLLASRSPSPGEARKLLLGLGFAQLAKLLVLDEPTNHLDLPAIERLEQALAEYPGAISLVTHDETLARKCTTKRWSLGEDGFRETTL